MRIIDATARTAIQEARSEAREALGCVLGFVALLVLALTVREAIPGPWGWILVGLLVAEVWTAGLTAVDTRRSARQVARCSTCRPAAIDAGRALDGWEACADSKHAPVVGGAA